MMFKVTHLVRLSTKLTKIGRRPLSNTFANFEYSDLEKCRPILDSFYLIEDFISEEEEQNLLVQCEKVLKRRRYENSHFDYAIHQYKEVEFKDWNEQNLKTIERIKALGFSVDEPRLLDARLSRRVNRLAAGSGDSNLKLQSEANCGPLSQPGCGSHDDRSRNHAESTQPSSQSITLSTAQSTLESTPQSTSQSTPQSPIDQSVRQPANQSVNQQFASHQRLALANATNGEHSTDNEQSDKTENDQPFRIIPEVHILDLRKDGYIKPHVDAVRFCGSRIVGVSLLSNAIMRLASTDDKSASVDALLRRRSLYLMADFARYNCTHEILANEESLFGGQRVERDRRISIIARCMPDRNVQEKL